MDFPIKTAKFSELSPSFQQVIAAISDAGATQTNPFILHTIGIPGAGKSTLVSALSESLVDEFAQIVSFDRIMKSIPEYGLERDLKQAFALYELPARAAGYVLIKQLMEAKSNILFDHSASASTHVELLRFAKNVGYTIYYGQNHRYA